MGHLGQWFPRFKIILRMRIMPFVTNRILLSVPDDEADMPTEEWATQKLEESLIFLSKTGPRKGGKLALPTLSLLRNGHRPDSRAGKTSPHVILGEVISRVDYSPQSLKIGNLH